MIIVYILAFLLLVFGAFILLGLNPDVMEDDIMSTVSTKNTLRDRVMIARGKKKGSKIAQELLKIRDALVGMHKEKVFALCCFASFLFIIAGVVLAALFQNYFLIPVFAVGFAIIPFAYAKTTIAAYERNVKEELETALSVITSAYIRSDNLVEAVRENIVYIKPPVVEVFKSFVTETTMLSADTKRAIMHMREKIDNSIYREWCDALLACQDDRSLNDNLLSIVAKLTDVRIVNSELQTLIQEPRKEYWAMVALTIANIPLLFFLNKDWFLALVATIPGKIVLAVVALAILITAILLYRFTRPIEYKR